MIAIFGVPQPLMSRWVVGITFDTVRERFIWVKGVGEGGTYMYMMLTCNSNSFCKLPIFGSNTML